MQEDIVNHPAHYTGVTVNGHSVECLDVIEALGLDSNHHVACAFKYLWRIGKKEGEVQNLKKAVAYLNRKIALMEHQ